MIEQIRRVILQGILLLIWSISALFSQTVTWNLNTHYGVDQSGFTRIFEDAREHFLIAPDDTFLITIDEGEYIIGGNGSYGINLNKGMLPGAHGRLIISGAGMDKTTLIFSETPQDMIHGRKVYRTEFRDMHMSRPGYTVTQGNVVSVAPGEVVLELHEGYPTPLDLWKDWEQGRFLRRYTDSKTDPQVILEDNEQIPYGYRNKTYVKPELLSGRQWRFFLNKPTLLAEHYMVGDLVGVKSKHEGNTYWMSEGDDLIFRNITWTGSSRGVARGGFNNVKIIGCRVERGAPINGQMPCLSTPSGGPQMNQYSSSGDTVATGMVVDDFFCDSPGDDCVAFFNVDGGKVLNSSLRNSFARGIMVSQEAEDICVKNTTIPNSPIERENRGTIVKPPLIVWSVEDAVAAEIINDDCENATLLSNDQAVSLSSTLLLKKMQGVLRLTGKNELIRVALFAANGKQLLSLSPNSLTVTFTVNRLARGVYLLRVIDTAQVQTLSIRL